MTSIFGSVACGGTVSEKDGAKSAGRFCTGIGHCTDVVQNPGFFGAELGYGASRLGGYGLNSRSGRDSYQPTHLLGDVHVWVYAISGTEMAYGAMRYPVPT
eukprot:3938987-Rhodomonas_salina.1